MVVGEDPFPTGNSFLTAQYVAISPANPAPVAGTLTTLQVNIDIAATIYALTGTLSGSNFTVNHSVSLSAAAGVNTLSMSLPIAAGDVLAVWSNTAQAGWQSGAAGGTLYNSAAAFSTPPTGTFAVQSTGNSRACLRATP